ncbi:MAG: hypothetical protein P1U50_00980 [Parvibaculaceae bacterium]|nr:hypothetical protein [Parvibaculaceae bacterium]
MTEEQLLISEIEAFCEAYGFSPSGFSRQAMSGDGKFVSDVKSGKRSPTTKTMRAVRAFISSYAKQKEGAQ